MITALHDFQHLIRPLPLDPVNQTVLAIDPPRPPAGQALTQWFRLTYSPKRRSSGILNERVQSREHLGISGCPVQILLPSLREKNDVHLGLNIWDSSSHSTSIPSPRSASARASSSRHALAGLDNKCSVSAMPS